jgi:hypothetical protein
LLLGKYIRKEDWKPLLPSISEIREFKKGDSPNPTSEKYIYADAKYTCSCIDGDTVIIKDSHIKTGKWIIDDPMTEIFKER